MSMSTTLRLAGLVAAIAVSLSITSSALAKPEGSVTMSGPADNPAEVGTPSLPQSPVVRADNPAEVGTPSLPQSPVVRADNPAEVGTPSLSQSPVVRADNPADIGTPVAVLLPPVATTAPSNGFSWDDATLGALVGLALAGAAAFAMGSLRGRRLAIRA